MPVWNNGNGVDFGVKLTELEAQLYQLTAVDTSYPSL